MMAISDSQVSFTTTLFGRQYIYYLLPMTREAVCIIQ